jgi:GAF domain-containing protein
MFLQKIYTIQGDADTLTRLRIRFVQALATVSSLLGIVGFFANLAFLDVSDLVPVMVVGIFTIVSLALLVQANRSTRIPGLILVVILLFSTYAIPNSVYLLLGMATLIAVAVLGNNWQYALVNVLVYARGLLVIVPVVLAAREAGTALPAEFAATVTAIMALGVASFFTRYFIAKVEQTAINSLKAAQVLAGAAEIGQELGKITQQDQLLRRAIEMVSQRFDLYHVQVFLLDEEGKQARLVASTGAVGQRLFERQHSLAVGSRSVIGTVTAQKRTVIARSTDKVYYRNELLPNTEAECAIPIMDGSYVIGALDMQSRDVNAFIPEVVNALEVVANLLGTGIRNARLFSEQGRAAEENKRLFLQAENNLREAQRLNQQLTRQGWDQFLGDRQGLQGVAVGEAEIERGVAWSPTLEKASLNREPVVEMRDGQRVIAVPMIVGNEVIGAIEVETDEDASNQEVTEMVGAIAQRLAVSLDKARLFEETQEQASREQRINQIVAQYQTVGNVDELLRITLQELGESLGAEHGAIRLSAVPTLHVNGEKQA